MLTLLRVSQNVVHIGDEGVNLFGQMASTIQDAAIFQATGEVVKCSYQGVEMGRPGRVRVQRNANGCMSISGQATPIFRGELLTGY